MNKAAGITESDAMTKVLEYIKDVLSVLLAMVSQEPNKRFDRLNGVGNDSYESLSGKEGVVTDKVSFSGGRVRYSGAEWRAELHEEESSDQIEVGETVEIISSSGNRLIVSAKR